MLKNWEIQYIHYIWSFLLNTENHAKYWNVGIFILKFRRAGWRHWIMLSCKLSLPSLQARRSCPNVQTWTVQEVRRILLSCIIIPDPSSEQHVYPVLLDSHVVVYFLVCVSASSQKSTAAVLEYLIQYVSETKKHAGLLWMLYLGFCMVQ